MIAIAFMIDGFFVDMDTLDVAERSLFGTITPAAAFFKNVGNVAFGFMLPILAGYIAESIAERPGLVAGFVGGALAASGTSGFLGALIAGLPLVILSICLKSCLHSCLLHWMELNRCFFIRSLEFFLPVY